MRSKSILAPVLWCVLVAAAAGFLGAPHSAFAAARPRNLLANGGFEHWTKPTPQQLAAQGKGGPKLRSHLAPAGWQYLGQSRYGPGPVEGSVARDAKVKHGGKYALRITNGLPSDITDVNQMIPCRPNSVYRLRCYVKGRAIKPNPNDGVGAMVWLNYGPKSFWQHQTASAHNPPQYRGTFGWEKLAFTVNTGPQAAFLMVTLQLRRATGTVWYDDVKLIRQGGYKHVKSY